jgi:hypothetical protein
VHREVGEEAALGGGEGAGDEVEGGQRDDRVSETTEAVDEDALRGGIQGGNSLRQVGAESNGNLAGFPLQIWAVRRFLLSSGARGEGGNRRTDFCFGASADRVLSATLHVDTSYA